MAIQTTKPVFDPKKMEEAIRELEKSKAPAAPVFDQAELDKAIAELESKQAPVSTEPVPEYKKETDAFKQFIKSDMRFVPDTPEDKLNDMKREVLRGLQSKTKSSPASEYINKGMESLSGDGTFEQAPKYEIGRLEKRAWDITGVTDVIKPAVKFAVPNTFTVGVPGLNYSIPIGGSRQEGTWSKAGERGVAEKVWDWQQETVAYGVDKVGGTLKDIIGAENYKSLNDNRAVKALKDYVGFFYDVNRAVVGAAMEITEFATTPEGIAQLVLFKKLFGGAAKVSALADVNASVKTGVMGKVQAAAKAVNRLGEPAIDLLKRKNPRIHNVLQKTVNGIVPTNEELKAAADEAMATKAIVDGIDNEITAAVNQVPLPKEIFDYEAKFGQPKTSIIPAPKDYPGNGVTRIDRTLVNIDEVLKSERLTDTPIRDEKMTFDDSMQYVNKERNVTKTPPMSKDYPNLKSSITTEGVKTPVNIIVKRDGSVIVNDGTHRMAAAKAAGHDYIPAKISYEGLADKKYPLIGLAKKLFEEGKLTKGEMRAAAYKLNAELDRYLATEERPLPELPPELATRKTIIPKIEPIINPDGSIPKGNWELPDPKSITEADLLPMPPKKWWKGGDIKPDRSGATLKVMKELKTAYGVGKFKYRNAEGIFKPDVTVIRSKEAFNPATISHEVGHRIADLLYDEYPRGRTKVNPELAKYSNELDNLAYKGAKNLTDEGFAEFIRILNIDPPAAKRLAPNFYESFVKRLQTKPEVWAALSKFQRSQFAFTEASPVARIHSIQKPKSQSGAIPWFKNMIQKFRDDPRMALSDLADEIGYKWFNDLGHTDRVFRSLGGPDAFKLHRNDPVILMRLLGRGKAGRIRAALETGLFSENYQQLTEGFHTYLKPISRPFKDKATGKSYPGMFDEGGFWDYALTRRSIEAEKMLQDKGARDGKAIGIPLRIQQAALEFMENPTYKAVFDNLVKFKRTLDFRTLVQDTEMLTRDAFIEMDKRNPNRLFPLSRIMDEGARHRIERIGKGGIKIRRLKGSGRDIVHPYEAMVDEISRQIMTADQAIAERKLADFTGGIKGGGGVFEKVPRETKIIQFKYDELRNGLKKTLNRTVEGYPELMSEIDALFDAIGGEQGNLYRAGGLNPMQRIVFRDGKAEVWEYKDPWIRDSFVGADKASVGPVIKAMQLAAKVARFGMTVLNPDFAFRNWLRDTSTRFINTEGNPTIFIPDMAKAMVEAFGGKSAEYKLYQASGGPLSGLYGTDINAVKKAMTKVEAGNWYYIKHPWEAVIDANAFLEDVSRFAEFKAGYGKSKAKAIADNVKAGMNKEQAIRDFELNPLKLQKREAVLRGGLAAREGTIDFLTSGASARKYNEVTAFFTANMGGLRKVAMMLKQNPSKTLLRGVGALTIPTIALWVLNKDNPEYQRKDDYQKWFFFNLPIGNGKFAMFPKPPGWGWVFSTQLEEYLNWLYKNNPKSELITNLTDAFVSEYVPSIIPNAGQGFAAWGMGYDWFRGIDIVPEGEKRLPPFLQASQFNSETAKWLAYNLRQLPNWKALDLAKSPRMFEGVGKVQFGGTFRTGLDIADTIGYTTKRAGLGSSEYFDKLPSMGKMPIVRSVISSPRYRSSSLASDFYDKLAEINMVYNEDKLLGRQGRVNVRREERERNSKLLRNYWLFNSVSRLVTDKNFEFKKVELDEKMDDKIKEAKLIRLGNEIDGLYKKALDKIRE